MNIETLQFIVGAFQLHVNGLYVQLAVENAQRRVDGIYEAVHFFILIIADCRLENAVSQNQIQEMNAAADHRICPFQNLFQIWCQLLVRNDTGHTRIPECTLIQDVDRIAVGILAPMGCAKIRRTENIVIDSKYHGVKYKVVNQNSGQFRDGGHGSHRRLHLTHQFLPLLGKL